MKSYPSIGQSFGIVGIIILGTLLLSPVNLVLNKWIGAEASMFIYYTLAMGIPSWIIFSIRKRRTEEASFNLSIRNKLLIPLVMLVSVALLFGFITPIASLIPFPELFKKVMMDMVVQNGFFTFMYMVVAAPILEELVFRGIMLDGLLKKYSPATAILMSSLLFGIVHLNPWQFVTAFILGLFMGWVYYKTRSLSLSIIIHATANLTGFLMRLFGDFDPSSIDETLVESYGGLFNLVAVIVGSVLVVLLCLNILNKEFKKKAVQENA